MSSDASRPGRAHPGNPDTGRIAAYLEGEASAFALVDGWIRTEIRVRFPVLRSDADDLAQTVHARLLENLRSGAFQGRSTLETYVVHMTRYRAVDRLRRTRRDPLFTDTDALDRAAGGEGPYARVAAKEKGELLRRILLLAPAACRELWRLVMVDGLAIRDAARRLSIPEGTVKSRLWYCRRRAFALFDRLTTAGRAGDE